MIHRRLLILLQAVYIQEILDSGVHAYATRVRQRYGYCHTPSVPTIMVVLRFKFCPLEIVVLDSRTHHPPVACSLQPYPFTAPLPPIACSLIPSFTRVFLHHTSPSHRRLHHHSPSSPPSLSSSIAPHRGWGRRGRIWLRVGWRGGRGAVAKVSEGEHGLHDCGGSGALAPGRSSIEVVGRSPRAARPVRRWGRGLLARASEHGGRGARSPRAVCPARLRGSGLLAVVSERGGRGAVAEVSKGGPPAAFAHSSSSTVSLDLDEEPQERGCAGTEEVMK
jgi:hypothetical protein